ncbi:carbohydrate ABC transporter permease [Kribbella steppae]|uniref:carbohydrate ABC transporter permease n=1 Tax=Kribbella steppae TaxID=2512223 RepID=UPI001F541E7B|nr:carbohydrate ABC transporter permease [Kribbella steppae]
MDRLTGRLIDLVLVVGGLLMIAPLVWLIVNALSEPIDAFQLPPRWIPRPPSLQSFQQVPDLIPFAQMAWNSLQIAVITTAGSLLTSALAAYAFSRLRFPGRDQIFSLLLAALVVPVQLTVVPVFILMRWLHLVDTTAAIWLPALVNVFGIFFLRQYIASIPRELDEAAIMDGAGHGWILFRVILPLARPGLTALGIFVFEASWNNFFWPYIFLSSPEKMTLPVGLVSLQGAMGGGPAVVLFAAITLVVLPILVLFLIFQRSFIASIASTGLRA